MSIHQSRPIREAFLSRCDISDWNAPFAVTLTMKQAAKVGGRYIPLTPIDASDTLKHFRNYLSRELFGRGAKRKRMLLNCISVLEDDGVRAHYHLRMDMPDTVTREQFTKYVHDCWAKTRFGYKEVDVRPCNDGWISYMCKFRTKSNFADAIDWMNFENSECC